MNESNHHNPINAATIERMIDDELDQPSRKQLLIDAEETPGAWRQVAIAFLESQQIEEGIKQFLSSPAAMVLPEVTESHPQRKRGAFGYLSGLAAALLLLILGGVWQWQHNSHLKNNDKIRNDIQFTQQQKIPQQKTLPLKTNPAFYRTTTYQQPETTTLRFRHPVTDEIIERNLLVVDAKNSLADFREWISQNEGELHLPEEIQNELEEQGIVAKMNRTFYTIPLENGLHAIVPLETSSVNYTLDHHLQ